MRLVLVVLLAAACSGSKASRTDRSVRDIDLADGVVDLHDWDAWTVSPDGSVIAAAPRYGSTGGVVIDAASGAVERHDDQALVLADSPLFWLPVERAFWDAAAGVSFALPYDEDDAQDEVYLRNNGAGLLARLARKGRGARLTLQAWNRAEQPSWSTQFAPAPDNAGIALSPAGDSLAFVQAASGALMTITVYDLRDGSVRWSKTSTLRAGDSRFVNQRIEYGDDGSTLWVYGAPAGSIDKSIEVLRVSDGSSSGTFAVSTPLPFDGDDGRNAVGFRANHLWVSSIGHARGDGAHGWGAHAPYWFCEYVLYDLEHHTTRRSDADDRAIFGTPLSDRCSARALRPTKDGGIVLLQVRDVGLRLTTWKAPPGTRSRSGR